MAGRQQPEETGEEHGRRHDRVGAPPTRGHGFDEQRRERVIAGVVGLELGAELRCAEVLGQSAPEAPFRGERGVGCCLKDAGERLARCDERPDPVSDAALLDGKQFDQHCFLAGEVGVERAPRDPHLLGDHRDFGGREPWIDFSQYPQNWPELAGRNTAAA